jgi:hypothetical protein
MLSRLAARLLTGPLGHFVAGAVDVLVALSVYVRARLMGREPW